MNVAKQVLAIDDNSSRADKEIREIAGQVFDERFTKWRWLAQGFLLGLGVLTFAGIASSDFRQFMLSRLFTAEVKAAVRDDPEFRDAVIRNVAGALAARIDSGYARTIYFGPGVRPNTGQDILQFSAKGGEQTVTLYIRAQGAPKISGEYVLQVDGREARLSDGMRPSYPHPFLTFDLSDVVNPPKSTDLQLVGADTHIHTIRIQPINLDKQQVATFELIVLVSNVSPNHGPA